MQGTKSHPWVTVTSGRVGNVRRAGMPHRDQVVLGLDIGGTKLAAGVVAGDGRVLSFRITPSRREDGPIPMITRLVDLAQEAVDDAALGWPEIRCVGIAIGGPLDAKNGVVRSPPNLPGWDDVPLASIAGAAFKRPIFVDNDATAAAIAEWWYGAGARMAIENLVYLTISTGIGGGLILDGRVYRGAGNAGELGHMTVEQRGRQCGCGRHGCLEAYASGTSIAARAREAVLTDESRSVLADLAVVTAQTVAEAAVAGDPLARRIWDETTLILGAALADILNVFNPDLIVLGGGLTGAGGQLLDPVRKAALAQAMAPARESSEIVLAALGEHLSVVSAAAVAFERLPTLASDA